MRAKDFRHSAWDRMKGKWGAFALFTLIYGLISGALTATLVGELLVTGPLTLAFAIVCLGVIREDRPVKLEDLFAGFREGNIATTIIAGILVPLFTALWSLLFIIPGIVKGCAYSMTFYVLRDNPEMSATEAIAASQAMMKGHKWRFFCLQLSFIGWILLCGLTFGILIFWVMPYMEMAKAEFYENLKSQKAE